MAEEEEHESREVAHHGADDETRRKFAEALSRKHGAAVAATGHRASGNIHLPEGNTKRQRVFRRKAGG